VDIKLSAKPELLRVVENFLKQHIIKAFYLLSNLQQFGPDIGESSYSGTYHVVVHKDKTAQICAVFVHKKSGNLHVQLDDNLTEIGQKESIIKFIFGLVDKTKLVGLIGDADTCKSLYRLIIENHVWQKTLTNPEEEYSLLFLDLQNPQNSENSSFSEGISRLFKESEFDAYLTLSVAFLTEQNIPDPMSIEEKRTSFLESVQKNMIWTHVIHQHVEKPVAMACVNTIADGYGMVRGVFTDINCRRKGFGISVMRKLIEESKSVLGLKGLILWTHKNQPAKLMYEKLGFKYISDCGMIFGQI